MGKSVADLRESMSSDEISYWKAYEQLTGPLGQERDDVLAALVAERVTSMLAGDKSKKVDVKDFIPQWGGKSTSNSSTGELDPHEFKKRLLLMNKRFQGTTS